MRNTGEQSNQEASCDQKILSQSGFGLTELLVSTLIVVYLSAGIFGMLTRVQSTSGYQTEVLNVMDNTRVGMSSLQRYIVQAGSNPRGAVFTPVTITSASQIRLCADLTGSSGGSQGDPDGDILDANEDITIRYNADARRIDLVDGSGTHPLARNISGFSMQYYDKNGAITANGADVRKIRVNITGTSPVANPSTHKTFGLSLSSDFTLPNRG